MACARRRIRPIDRLVAAHITKIGLKSLFFSGLLGETKGNRRKLDKSAETLIARFARDTT